MAPGIRDPSVSPSGPLFPNFLILLPLPASLTSPRARQLRRSWSGWRGKGTDVTAGQGKQSVGRDVDAGMTGTQGGSGIDQLDGSCFWGGRSCGWKGWVRARRAWQRRLPIVANRKASRFLLGSRLPMKARVHSFSRYCVPTMLSKVLGAGKRGQGLDLEGIVVDGRKVGEDQPGFVTSLESGAPGGDWRYSRLEVMN